MGQLRWALIGLGALFLLGLALWEWRRGRRRFAQAAPEVAVPAAGGAAEDWARRVEPRIDSLLDNRGESLMPEGIGLHDVPVIHPSEPVEVPVAREAAVDLPAAANRGTPRPQPVAIRWPPERADRVLTLRVIHAQGAQLAGREVRLALEQSGLQPGPQTIYHLADAEGAVLVSAANMLRPGDLDPKLMDEQQLRGLSLFSVLPGPLPPVRMLEELVAVARALSWRLGAVVQDDQGTELDGDALLKLRQSLPDAAESSSP